MTTTLTDVSEDAPIVSGPSWSGRLLSALPGHLLGRLYLLAAVLIAECLLLASIPHTASLLGPVAPFGIVFYAVFVGLGYSRIKAEREQLGFSVRLLAAHLLCVAAVAAVNVAAWRWLNGLQQSHTAHVGARVMLLVGILFLALACLPFRAWVRMVRATGKLWVYASLAGLLAWCLRYPMQSFWDASSSAPGRVLQVIAFRSVRIVLGFVLPDVMVDAASFSIGTPRFSVTIAEACSGMEGLGLVLVFTIVWLWYFRRESRFPQALLLVPAALLCVWFLNIVRIAALVMIGNAGSPEVAMVGFHSQAGWIAFTAVAFGFSMATRRLRWVRRIPAEAGSQGKVPVVVAAQGESAATGAYLLPFLAILGASFVTKSASGYFEWLYPLRFVAAAVALWFSWPEIRELNWKFGWLAPLTGAAIFAVWIAPTFWSHEGSASSLAAGLAALSPAGRFVWIAFRVAAAVVTVPIAEELAFRGYLARRIMSRDFDGVGFKTLSMLSIALSSVAFGLMHGQHWFVGILAGLAYAGVLRWKGRMGDAVVAHATSNLLLAAWVLTRGDWAQW